MEPKETKEEVVIVFEDENDKDDRKGSIYDDVYTDVPLGWEEFFEQVREEVKEVSLFLEKTNNYYPESKNIFKVFRISKPEDIKCFVLGQDPYPQPGAATGIAFSVGNKNYFNPTLKNIIKEMKDEGFSPREDGDLTYLSLQGVFLYNVSLTVERGVSDSHTRYWVRFSEKLLRYISSKYRNIAFVFWGGNARGYLPDINNKEDHCILKSAHPSPLSARKGFFGNNHFRMINEYLISKDKQPVIW